MSAPVHAVEAAATTGFFAKFCCDKNQAICFLSLVTAVAGLAYSIFETSVLGSIGFILLGISTLIFRSLNNAEIEKVEQEITESAEKNAEAMNQLTDRMNQQITTLETNRDEMQQQLTLLQADIEKKQTILKELETSQTALKEENEQLKQLKTLADQALASVKENSAQFQSQLQAMLKENLTMSQTLGDYGHSVDQLTSHQDQLQNELNTFDGQLNGNMDKLNQQLQLVASSTKGLMTAFVEKAKAIQTEFQDEIQQSRVLNASVQSQVDLVKQADTKLNESLGEVSKKVGEELHARGIQQQIEQQTALEQVQQLTADIQEKSSQLQQLDILLANKLQLVTTYDRKIEEKQAQLMTLKTEKQQLEAQK